MTILYDYLLKCFVMHVCGYDVAYDVLFDTLLYKRRFSELLPFSSFY